MIIRRAKIEDQHAVVPLILSAMEDIVYNFIQKQDYQEATQFIADMYSSKGNQYSFENTWVVETNSQILAAGIVYNGADLQKLRTPIQKYIESKYGHPFQPEDETQAGEYYIDCVGVHPLSQGKGIGSALFQFFIQEYVENQNQTLGLLVENNNPQAKKLYLKLGFKVINECTLTGKKMEHLQYHN